jgi:fibronectin-binding autotransporter adhesin
MAAIFRFFSSFGSSGRAAVWLGFGFAAALTAGPALGQSSSWNVDADGNWTTGSNWLSGTNAAGNGNTGTFANDITATRTVTLDANRALGTVVFGDADPSTAASWIIAQGGTSTLSMNNNAGNDATITVNALGTGATATISAPLGANVANTPTIIKDGVGTLVLSNAANPFTANLAITAGTLQVGADRNLGGTGSGFTANRITISNGATLATTAAFTMNANRGITIGTGGGTLNLSGGALTYPARFTGAGQTLTTTGSAGLILNNGTGIASDVNWDFTGSNTRIFFASTNALGSGSVLVRDNVRLVSTGASTGTVGNAITLSDGGGLTARTAAVTFNNVAFPSTGTVILNKDDQQTFGLTVSSGASLTGDLTIDTSQQSTNPVGDVTLSGVFSGSSGAIIKAGTGASGKVILDGANTYGGNTTINTGTLALGAAGSIANSPAVVVASGATFDVSAVTGGFTLGAAQALNGVGTVVGNVAADGTLSPGLSGGVGTLSFGNNLSLGSGSILNFGLDGGDSTVGGGVNDLIDLTDLTAGDLVLDGGINVTETVAGSFSSVTTGSWRLFNYTGTLTDNGLSLGTLPSLPSGFQFGIDTTTANQVNLVVSSAVPEPGTIVTALVGLGLCGVAMARRRARRNF